MELRVEQARAREACADSISAFVRAVGGFDEYALLAPSRCHGWSRLDVVTHVIGGWQEMFAGLVSLVETEPTVDAASYWSAFTVQYADEDPVATLMAQRRRSGAYARPGSAVEHLGDVATALLRGVNGLTDRACLWQGHVFAAGDYLAVWAVENVVHHLDLVASEPAPPSGLALTRASIEAIVDAPLPASWTDEEATLIGTGRSPVPAGFDALAARLPALG